MEVIWLNLTNLSLSQDFPLNTGENILGFNLHINRLLKASEKVFSILISLLAGVLSTKQ